jgi:hypothetical protein
MLHQNHMLNALSRNPPVLEQIAPPKQSTTTDDSDQPVNQKSKKSSSSLKRQASKVAAGKQPASDFHIKASIQNARDILTHPDKRPNEAEADGILQLQDLKAKKAAQEPQDGDPSSPTDKSTPKRKRGGSGPGI